MLLSVSTAELRSKLASLESIELLSYEEEQELNQINAELNKRVPTSLTEFDDDDTFQYIDFSSDEYYFS